MSQNEKITKIEANIYYLDSRKLSNFGVSGVYFIIGEGITLIETGTTLNALYILEAVRELGFEEKDIRNAIVTHIHLDHSGATGWLARHLPRLKVYVHERGLEHLHDPSKLIKSAKAVYGDLETINIMHGEILPVPKENLIPVKDFELDAGGGVKLKIFDAPGHSYHHLCIHEPQSGCLFSGEALGHYKPETGRLSLAVAPPGFDYEATLETIKKIEEYNPRIICFSQFGQHHEPTLVIEKAQHQVRQYYDVIRNQLRRGLNTEEIIKEIGKTLSGEKKYDIEKTDSMFRSIVLGYQIYFSRTGKLQ
ncbi:MAG: MBL fold metallo-hydrolase [Deltaproteobacteria bacterium]|nr:MBL fold metallo-hydrolase [Deltaproteobacteria bacterium]MBW2139451.1 MBL fold metallo-hydrolase [Deltaproteobacteria bacterium]MBW2324645.1 MBL fold metallo-hydrolase [Deltaproteobacteria bacterium]